MADLTTAATATPPLTPQREKELKTRVAFISDRKAKKPLYYGDYLQLDKILNAQKTVSSTIGAEAHDEHLFVVIHQVYELWFKQVLYEMDSVLALFAKDYVDDKLVSIAVSRLHRVTEILRVLFDQLAVLETMSPLDFLDFRDFLFPASGFQSKQFRVVENKLGLRPGDRLKFGKAGYCSYLNEEDAKAVKDLENTPSLFEAVEKWLERTPFVQQVAGTNCFQIYKDSVYSMLEREAAGVNEHENMDDATRANLLKEIESQRKHFNTLVDEEQYKESQARGERRLSHKAMTAALIITLYKEEPILQLPYQLLKTLLDIDELLTAWRYRHALMVHRMLGVKIGTGGSSGYHYLRSTAQRHKIFSDFANVSTFLIPRAFLPELPTELKATMGFSLTTDMTKTPRIPAATAAGAGAGAGADAAVAPAPTTDAAAAAEEGDKPDISKCPFHNPDAAKKD